LSAWAKSYAFAGGQGGKMCITKARIEDRPINFISVGIYTANGCKPKEGEYEIRILYVIGSLDITPNGGNDDISLIQECIDNDLDFNKLPEEGFTEIILEESGEWEDVFWHKYYKIVRIVSPQ